MMNDRIRKLHIQLRLQDIDAFLVTNLVNIKYLTGFSGTFASLLVLGKKMFLFTDSRYYERAVIEAKLAKVIEISHDWPLILLKYNIKKLAFESDSVSYGTYDDWKKKLRGIKLVPTRNIIEKLRQLKDAEEIKKIRKAARITDELVRKTVFKRGISELGLIKRTEDMMRSRYRVRPSFSIIAAFGKNASVPHAKPGNKKLAGSQMALLDLGVELDGYSSDLTRTFWVGKITSQFSKIYNIVLAAQKLAIDGIRPGRNFCEIDELSRGYINKCGYGKHFGHSLGHGIGLTVHELPRVNFRNKEKIEKGMVFSVEPGIYLPGWGGVRIEDLVLVTDNGCEVLSKSPKELEDIVL